LDAGEPSSRTFRGSEAAGPLEIRDAGGRAAVVEPFEVVGSKPFSDKALILSPRVGSTPRSDRAPQLLLPERDTGRSINPMVRFLL
jgi:hypothetical protein